MKPGHNEHPHEEGDDIDVGVDDVPTGVSVNISHKVEDPGFVEDCIDLSDKKDQTKPMSKLKLP